MSERANRRCVVLVPTYGGIDPMCEASLQQLERRGYTVRRVGGYSQIDLGRGRMATDALTDGFDETMWIDSDIGFDPADVDRLRSHNVDIVGGVYAIKRRRALAVNVGDRTEPLRLGRHGGLIRVRYIATGFLLVRRRVYETVRRHAALRDCTDHHGKPFTPFFFPMTIPHPPGRFEGDDVDWYLGEDYSFCERAGRAGMVVHADTSVRLLHYGRYGYGWEDAGEERPRYPDYTYHLGSELGDR